MTVAARRAPAVAAAALVGAASLPGCGAIFSYGLEPRNPLEPLGGMLIDGEALGALASEGPFTFLFFSPFVLADLTASLALDLALLPFVLLDHLSGRDPEPSPRYDQTQPAVPPPPPPAAPPPPDAPAEWPLLVGVAPSVVEPPAGEPRVSGPDLDALVASIGAGDRGRLHLVTAHGVQVEPGVTSVAAAAPLPDGQLAYAHRYTVEAFDPAAGPPVRCTSHLSKGDEDSIVGLAAREDGACFVYSSVDGAWLCPLEPGWSRTVLVDAPRGGRAIAVRGRLAAVGGWNGAVSVHAIGPLTDGEPAQATLLTKTSVSLPGEDWPTAGAGVATLAWQAGELVIGRADGQLLRWAPLGELPPTPAGPSLGSAPLALQVVGEGLVVGLADGRVLLVEGGEERLLGRHAGPVVALHAHAGRVASAGLDGVVRLLALEPAGEALDALDLGPLEDVPCGVALDQATLVVVTRRGLLLRYEVR